MVGVYAASVLSACDVTIKDGDVSINHAQGRATREWTRKYVLAPNGRVEIVNVNGPIEIGTGPAGAVDVAAVLTTHAMTEERAKQILSEADIEESATPELVRVASARRSRSRGPGGLEVSYKVIVPDDARVDVNGNNGSVRIRGSRGSVKALVVNGEVELTDLQGPVDAASMNGHLSVKMASVTGRIRLESTNGRISLEVPKNAKATLNARSMNGGISVTGLETPEVSGRRIRTLESAINGGGPEIELRVMNGRITLTGR
jgi:Putative adhesin